MNTILIVDDSIVDRTLTKKILQSGKFRIVELDKPTKIDNVLQKDLPDLILLDIIMPEMNGFELCRKLKSEEKTKNIPVIILSCKTQKSDIFWGKLQGADDYITKPYNPAQLLQAVQQRLGKN